MCNCIEKVEMEIINKFNKEDPNREWEEPPGLGNKSYNWQTGAQKLYAPITGKYLQGKRTRKIDTFLVLTYCPFCGEKYE